MIGKKQSLLKSSKSGTANKVRIVINISIEIYRRN